MTESIEYRVLRTAGKVEIREYQAIVLISVQGMDDYGAFGILFDYISGNNLSRSRIPMTAPVISTRASGEKIPMTTPVISRSGFFAFVLPKGYTAQTAPKPIDNRAELVDVPARTLAVLRFRGRAGRGAVRSRTEELLSTLSGIGAKPAGNPFLMRYNPPLTPGFLRRNEVAVEIEQ